MRRLNRSLGMLAEADYAIFLPGWESAKGCQVERTFCEQYDIRIIDNEELNSLLTTITNQDKEIETKDLEITRLQAKIDKLEAEAAKLRERLTDSKKTVEKKSATKKASSKKATPQEEKLAD